MTLPDPKTTDLDPVRREKRKDDPRTANPANARALDAEDRRRAQSNPGGAR